MAEIKNGILSAFTGKVGPVSGYTRYGRNIMRTASSKVADKATPARIAQREKIKVCNAFINAFSGTGIFSRTFPDSHHGGSGYNRAMKYLMNSALKGEYPNYRVMYDKFLISQGPLPAPVSALVQVDMDGNLVFRWEDNSNEGTAKKGDQAVLVAFFSQKQPKLIYKLDAAARISGSAVLNIPDYYAGAVAETWIGFVSEDGRLASNSVYTGQVNV
jgi:Family of unknown function (DUF6266)